MDGTVPHVKAYGVKNIIQQVIKWALLFDSNYLLIYLEIHSIFMNEPKVSQKLPFQEFTCV